MSNVAMSVAISNASGICALSTQTGGLSLSLRLAKDITFRDGQGESSYVGVRVVLCIKERYRLCPPTSQPVVSNVTVGTHYQYSYKI
jgi:hypothetical protein